MFRLRPRRLIVSECFQPFDFQRVFPSLVDLHWECLMALISTNLDHLAQVTRLSQSLAFKSPFEILPHLQQAKFVECHCSYAIPDFDLQPFELKSLTNLKLICPKTHWSMAELKAVFTFFPNLIDLDLTIKGLADDYDEQVPT
jgi:hypothetical protein